MADIMSIFREANSTEPLEHNCAGDYYCANCRAVIVPQPGELCELCAKERAQGWFAGMKTGRCASGSELDAGTVYHKVYLKTGRAKCGTKPGRRSRWSDYHGKQVTCSRCK